MGAVYRARDRNFKAIRLVAVKEMISQVADPMVRKNIFQIFEREANLLATLRHPAIPRIYDYFTINDKAYLVLEFVQGKNLEQVISETEGFFSQEQVLSWAVEICDVLDYLHSHEPEPIIFRDVKPSNIMSTLQNHISLVDFGIAKVFDSGQQNTMIGTQGYSPPDQYRGEATQKVDIYALGATLHHLLTLNDPQLEAPFSFSERDIQKINPNVSPELVAVVERALAYDPADRYESAAEMKVDLMTVANKTGTLISLPQSTDSLGGTKPIKPLWRFESSDELRGSPTIDQGSIYLGSYDNNLYALNAMTGEMKWKYQSGGGIPGKAEVFEDNIYFGSEDQSVHVVSVKTGKAIWSQSTNGPVRSSPRISQGHVFIGSDDGFLYAINMASRNVSWKTELASPIRSTPFVDNEFVYFGSQSGDFACVDFRGEIRWRFKAKRAITSSPIISDGHVYFTSMDGALYSLEAKGGWVNWRFRFGKGGISTPFVVDNLVYAGSTDKTIYCIDGRNAKEIWRFQTEHQVTGSPIVHEDRLYCGSVDGFLYCLNAQTGQLHWKFKTDAPITGTPAISDGLLYVGSTDRNLYALPI
jgi:outer membrane protein assembly factor BamB